MKTKIRDSFIAQIEHRNEQDISVGTAKERLQTVVDASTYQHKSSGAPGDVINLLYAMINELDSDHMLTLLNALDGISENN